MAKKTIKITVRGAEVVALAKLEAFQGDLKHISKEQYERLRKGILDLGFSFAPHVWKNDGKFHLLDGHQRIFVLKQMVEIEGYKVAKIPVAVVEAANFAEAKRKVLAAASQYGVVSREGLVAYARENDIPYDEIVATYHFPEIDYSVLASDFSPPAPDDKAMPEPEDEPSTDKTQKSGSDLVKQLQLFFGADQYAEFVAKVEQLANIYDTQNVTDTLLEIVREVHSAHLKTE